MLYLRSIAYNIAAYSILLVGCVINSIVGPFAPQLGIRLWDEYFIPAFVWATENIAQIKIEIRGEQYIRRSDCIYAGKHESALETHILTNYLKSAVFILKKELTYIPIFGWAQHFYGMIPVNRSAGGRAMKDMLSHAKNRINLGRSIIIFPEGTRKSPKQEPDYKPGVVFLYNNLNVPVIPFATNTGYFWPKGSFLKFPGKVIIEFMEPMPAGLDKESFMTELQNRIENKCKELNAETEKNYPFNGLTYAAQKQAEAEAKAAAKKQKEKEKAKTEEAQNTDAN